MRTAIVTRIHYLVSAFLKPMFFKVQVVGDIDFDAAGCSRKPGLVVKFVRN